MRQVALGHPQGAGQGLRGDGPAHPPAGHGEGLRGGRDPDGALGGTGQPGQIHGVGVVVQVLVHRVREDQRVVGRRELHDAPRRLLAQHRARGVVRVVDHDHAGPLGEGRRQVLGVRAEVRRAQGHGAHGGPGQRGHGRVQVVEGFEDHDLIARAQVRQHRRGQGLGGPGGHGDLGLRVRTAPPGPLLGLGHAPAQVRVARDGRVLVAAAGHRLGQGLAQDLGAVRVREALAEVDRPVPGRQEAHLLEDRGGQSSPLIGQTRRIGQAPPGCGGWAGGIHGLGQARGAGVRRHACHATGPALVPWQT
ncbi:Uncharacterised protein [Mycobacteroides abscessus subsp. abscessus]|nr:Uncharacterised protein [Mycobacteroides abscessus subsp. abscessus]